MYDISNKIFRGLVTTNDLKTSHHLNKNTQKKRYWGEKKDGASVTCIKKCGLHVIGILEGKEKEWNRKNIYLKKY